MNLKILELCVFCSGAYDPKLEKEINKEQIRKIMNINFFGVLIVLNCEDYFKKKKRTYFYCFISCCL